MVCPIRQLTPKWLIILLPALSIVVAAIICIFVLNQTTLFLSGLILVVFFMQGNEPFNTREGGETGPGKPSGSSQGSIKEGPGPEAFGEKEEGQAPDQPGEREGRPGGWRGKKAKLAGGALAFVALLVIIFLAFPRPHFVVEALSGPREVMPGEGIVITAEVTNTGRAEGSYSATLFIEDSEVETKEFRLEAGAGEMLQFSFPASYAPGNYVLYLGLGPEKTISRSHEYAVRILKPAEFEIRSFNLSSNVINIGDEIEARIRVANIGEIAGRYTVEILKNDDIIESEDVALEGESETEVFLPLTIDKPGRHTLTVAGTSETLTAYQIERPANGTVLLNEISGGHGQLRIENNYPNDNFFVLSGADDPQTPLLAVYVRAESSAAVSGIRDGAYVSYYSFGEDWDSYSKQFTKNASYGRFTEEEEITTTHQADGSFYYTILENEFGTEGLEDASGTESVREEDFPSF